MFYIEQIRHSLSRNSNPESSIKHQLQSSLEPVVSSVEPELVLRSGPIETLKDATSGSSYDPVNGLAAVALVLSGPESDLSMCFIKRAERDGDPWSGHMAFPGGRASASDPTPRAIAERETEEEVGLRLNRESFLGELAYLPVTRRRIETGMVLYPFVYYIEDQPSQMVLSDEVAGAFWIPLETLWDTKNHGRLEFKFNGQSLLYPAIRFREYNIWGLTHRILAQFSEVIGNPLPSE